MDKSIAVVPVFGINVSRIENYWKTLYSHDLLRFRLADLKDPTWEDARDVTIRFVKTMYMVWSADKRMIVGEFMLENFTGKAAQIHFSVHPDTSFRDSIKIGSHCINTILNTWKHPDDTSKPYLETIFGLTPVDNKPACLYILKAGMKKVGVIPNSITNQGKVVDALVTVATRDN